MSGKSAIAILIIVGGLVLLTIQNLSPAISLVFLGMQLPTLPLSVWLLIFLFIGILTSLMIASLFQLSYTPSPSRPKASKKPIQPSPQSNPPDAQIPPSPQADDSEWDNLQSELELEPENQPPIPTSKNKSPKTHKNSDDWETEVRKVSDSWDENDSDRQNEPETPPVRQTTPKPSESESWNKRNINPLNSPNTDEDWDNLPPHNAPTTPTPPPPENTPTTTPTPQKPPEKPLKYSNNLKKNPGQVPSIPSIIKTVKIPVLVVPNRCMMQTIV
ncbi:LapA family protein [Arthrospira sp. PCC 9108]|nr:LapA family protein [Arthrospira sp. PCC 9108]